MIVDARRGRARRLRRLLGRATRAQFRALGIRPPAHLLIVVQRTVHGERPLAALLEVYEDAGGARRHVLFLALVVDEEPLSDGALLATLRQQLHAVAGDALGRLVHTVAAEAQRARPPAAPVPLRGSAPEPPALEPEAPPPDDRWAPAAPMDDGAYAVAAER